MKISSKGRYALAALTCLAMNYNSKEYVPVVSIAGTLGISKLYLEQIFSHLKRGGLVYSVKGAQGGYVLERMPGQITVCDVLAAVETSLFEKAEDTVDEKAPEIDAAMRIAVFDKLDQSVESLLRGVTLQDLVTEAQNQKSKENIMFYI